MHGVPASHRTASYNHVPPHHRDFIDHGRIDRFYAPHHHYFGYRVRVLPSYYDHWYAWHRNYYFYDGIFYRPFGSYYVVCRPPWGYTVADALLDASLVALDFAWYSSINRSYSVIDDNYATIAEQNATIAANNATIAAQNEAIERTKVKASESYDLASSLGLVQSYADASVKYYYQDGTFYIVNANGEYEVIVPPAGAIVPSLPDDYETITLDGKEYYRVDETVYRSVIVEGKPSLEVLGQLTGEMARKYGVYDN